MQAAQLAAELTAQSNLAFRKRALARSETSGNARAERRPRLHPPAAAVPAGDENGALPSNEATLDLKNHKNIPKFSTISR